MSRLVQNTHPAERERGCVFAENFDNAQVVVENGGVINGTPVIDRGCTFDGSTDYLQYNLLGSEFRKEDVTLEIEFYPDFSADDGVSRYIFDCSVNRCILYKSSSNVLAIFYGGVNITTVPLSVLEPLWVQGGKNLITITFVSGDTNAWLNGVKIVSNDPSTWGSTPSGYMSIGSTYVGSANFLGKITRVKIGHFVSTEQEHIDAWDNTTFQYMKDCVLNLPMRMSEHDPTNDQTLDRSGNGNNAQFGDGSTSSTFPTKLTTSGYSFDGVNDYLDLGSDILGVTELTLMSFVYLESFGGGVLGRIVDNGSVLFWVDGTLGTLKFSSNSGGNQATSPINTVRLNSLNTFCVSRNILGICNLYINGIRVGSLDQNSGTPIAGSNVFIGNNSLLSRGLDGNIKNFQVFSKALTPIQILDLHQNLLKQVNKI